jgi:hypothetical protein
MKNHFALFSLPQVIDILNDEKAVKVDFATLEHVLELQEKIAAISDKNEI